VSLPAIAAAAQRITKSFTIDGEAVVLGPDGRHGLIDILNTAARNVQVLILTCREELFEGFGGKALSLTDGSSEELLSA